MIIDFQKYQKQETHSIKVESFPSFNFDSNFISLAWRK